MGSLSVLIDGTTYHTHFYLAVVYFCLICTDMAQTPQNGKQCCGCISAIWWGGDWWHFKISHSLHLILYDSFCAWKRYFTSWTNINMPTKVQTKICYASVKHHMQMSSFMVLYVWVNFCQPFYCSSFRLDGNNGIFKFVPSTN